MDQGILFKLLKSIFKDPQLLKLFYRIIESYRTEKGRGMPIGNLTSQSFANMYLSELDHFIKDSLGIRQYVRYMDDICLWGDDRRELGEIKDKAMEFIHSRLNLAAKHIVLNRSAEGVPFLGFLIRPDHIYLLRSKKKRVLKRIGANYHELTRCHRSQKDFSVHIQPVISHLKLAKSRRMIYRHCQRHDQRLEPILRGVAGTTTPGTCGRLTATTTVLAIATTTTGSGWSGLQLWNSGCFPKQIMSRLSSRIREIIKQSCSGGLVGPTGMGFEEAPGFLSMSSIGVNYYEEGSTYHSDYSACNGHADGAEQDGTGDR